MCACSTGALPSTVCSVGPTWRTSRWAQPAETSATTPIPAASLRIHTDSHIRAARGGKLDRFQELPTIAGSGRRAVGDRRLGADDALAVGPEVQVALREPRR